MRLPCGCVVEDKDRRCRTAQELNKLAAASGAALLATEIRSEAARRCSLVHHANVSAVGAHLRVPEANSPARH